MLWWEGSAWGCREVCPTNWLFHRGPLIFLKSHLNLCSFLEIPKSQYIFRNILFQGISESFKEEPSCQCDKNIQKFKVCTAFLLAKIKILVDFYILRGWEQETFEISLLFQGFGIFWWTRLHEIERTPQFFAKYLVT